MFGGFQVLIPCLPLPDPKNHDVRRTKRRPPLNVEALMSGGAQSDDLRVSNQKSLGHRGIFVGKTWKNHGSTRHIGKNRGNMRGSGACILFKTKRRGSKPFKPAKVDW